MAELDRDTRQQHQYENHQAPLGHRGQALFAIRQLAVIRTGAAVLAAQIVAHAVPTARSAVFCAATAILTGALGTAAVAARMAVLRTANARLAGRVAGAVAARRHARTANGTVVTCIAPAIGGTRYAVLATQGLADPVSAIRVAYSRRGIACRAELAHTVRRTGSAVFATLGLADPVSAVCFARINARSPCGASFLAVLALWTFAILTTSFKVLVAIAGAVAARAAVRTRSLRYSALFDTA